MPWNRGIRHRKNNIGANDGIQIFFSHHGQIPSLSHHLAHIIMALLWLDIMPNATGYNHHFSHQIRHVIYQPTAWSQPSWQQLASSISTSSKELNKAITNNRFSFIPEMMCGQVSFFNETFWLILAQDGDLWLPKLEGPNNPCPNQNLRLLQLRMLTFSWCRCWPQLPKRDTKNIYSESNKWLSTSHIHRWWYTFIILVWLRLQLFLWRRSLT